MPKAMHAAATNCAAFIDLTSLTLWRENQSLVSSMAVQAKGRNRNDVNFDATASPAQIPRRIVGANVGFFIHNANAKRQANCVHMVGKSVYARLENARTLGSVKNRKPAMNPANVPNSRLAQRKTDAAARQRNGRIPTRARKRFWA